MRLRTYDDVLIWHQNFPEACVKCLARIDHRTSLICAECREEWIKAGTKYTDINHELNFMCFVYDYSSGPPLLNPRVLDAFEVYEMLRLTDA